MIEIINKLNEPTIDNAIRNMKFSKMMHLTKNGKFYSTITEEYLRDKEKYLNYIKEELKEDYMRQYRNVFDYVGVYSDAEVAYMLLNWEHTGDILMLLNENTNWKLVDKELYKQGHSGGTISVLSSKVFYYSPYGLDFIEHVYGLEERKKAEKEINKKVLKNK